MVLRVITNNIAIPNKDENNDQETQASLDADYNVDEFNLDEQLSDSEYLFYE